MHTSRSNIRFKNKSKQSGELSDIQGQKPNQIKQKSHNL